MAGLILGTGLGSLASRIDAEQTIDYDDIPHFAQATALSHTGRLVCGRLAGVPVVAMEGRCHGYEGYSLDRLTLPIYVMRALGVGLLVLSNAGGGLNPKFASGDVVVIEDHIDLMFRAGAAARLLLRNNGARLPTPCYYDPGLAGQAMAVARRDCSSVCV